MSAASVAKPRFSRGTVLVTVLLMVAVAAIIATDIAYRQQLEIKRTSAFLAREQAFQVLLAAEEIGHAQLMDDLVEDVKVPEPFDNLGEKWNQKVPPTPVLGGAGFVSGELEDLQGRFNINSLFATDPNEQALQKQRLIKLFNDLQIPDPDAPTNSGVSASGLVDRIIDWMDDNDDPTGMDGREEDAYLKRDTKPYRTANHLISDITELMLIEEFTQADIDKLRDHISFLPRDAALNLNTARKEVLIAYNFTTPDPFIQDRPDRGRKGTEYTDVNQIWPILDPGGTAAQQQSQTQTPIPGQPGQPLTPQTPNPTGGGPQGKFGLTSQYYLLKASAVINGKTVKMNSVIWRMAVPDYKSLQAGGSKQTPIKTVLRKLVDPLE